MVQAGGMSLLGGRHGLKQLNRKEKKTSPLASLSSLLCGFLTVLVAVYIYVTLMFISETSRGNNRISNSETKLGSILTKSPVANEGSSRRQDAQLQNSQRHYDYWKDLAVNLSALPADQVLTTLEQQDPFGVRQFEAQLLEMETFKQSNLDIDDIKKLFPCPSDRITVPDQRDHSRDEAYRKTISKTPIQTAPVFLFFQHLRKAGGTNFCSLAQKNLLRANVPSYFCMPDMDWSGKRCAGCITKFSNSDITTKMQAKKHLILGNEWDPFDSTRFFDLPAVFATSFRKPLHRALSQFRFECIEDRGCKIKVIEDWWKKRKDLANVYTWTFAKTPIHKISRGRSLEDAKKRQHAMGVALDTVAKFHLVLVMEWLAYAPTLVTNVLGFQDVSSLTTRVRPHIGQAKRNDGQEHNVLGAAGIAKASWDPKNYLSSEQYKIMSEDLALDEILTDAARRMFLERIVCGD